MKDKELPLDPIRRIWKSMKWSTTWPRVQRMMAVIWSRGGAQPPSVFCVALLVAAKPSERSKWALTRSR